MQISDYDYELPDVLIARYPADERRASRLLDLSDGIRDRQFSELPELLREHDLLVFNDTRVIPARLRATKTTGGRVEILIERIESDSVALVHLRASKSPQAGARIRMADGSEAEVVGRSGEFFRLRFSLPVMEVLDAHGEMPLPPYLGRDAESADSDRYQTVYARDPGAVAAPTAGLHFDQAMLDETQRRGVGHAFVTLHVGAGTFQALRDENVLANRLHAERVIVSADCVARVDEARKNGGRIIAVGTTAVRSLECASQNGTLQPFHGETDLFILPGYRFRTVDAMLTNFHLPQSSLLMLVSAFAGFDRTMAAYRHAIDARYRFFSYGDCMFLTPGADA